MKNKVKWIIGMAVIMLGGMTVSAAEIPYSIEYDYSNQSFVISGNPMTDGEWVTVQILKPDMSIAEDGDAAVLYRGQYTVTDSKYTFTVEYDDSIYGVCSGVLASNVEDNVTPFEVSIVSNTLLSDIYDKINAAAKENNFDAFKKAVNDNIKALTGNTVQVGNLSSELNDYFEYIKKNELKLDKSSQNTQILNSFLTIDKLNSGNIENIQGMIGVIYLDEALKNDYVALATTGGIQKYFTEKLSDKDISDLDEFELAFKEALILTTAKYGSAYGELKNIVTKYGDSFGITGTASATVYKSLLGIDHKTASDFKTAYDKAVKSQNNTGGLGGGGGAGGSGSAGNGIASSSVNGTAVGTSGSDVGEKIEAIPVVFNDIEGVTWASEAILALADKGIVNGKGDGKFKPDDDVTREEFVKIIIGALGMSDAKYEGNAFSDVKDSDWFCKFVNIANENQIVKGIGGEMFGVGENITRQDMVVMVYNALLFKNAEVTSAELHFEDKSEIADYAYEAVCALYEMGAINGVSETRFEPMGTATRAQAAKVVYAVLKHLQ